MTKYIISAERACSLLDPPPKFRPATTTSMAIELEEKFIEHLDSHQEMAINHDMMFRKFKEYVLAYENFTE